jgi:hypothetical protein
MVAENLKTGESWTRTRPQMPGYGVPEDESGLLEWSAVAGRLAAAKIYWVCTASGAGVPHAVPVWGAFVDDVLYLGAGGPRTNRNLAANPRVTVHLESGDNVVIIEGVVAPWTGASEQLGKAIDDQYAGKYDWRPSSEAADGGIGDGWQVIRPDKIIAWTSFPADATRWTREG